MDFLSAVRCSVGRWSLVLLALLSSSAVVVVRDGFAARGGQVTATPVTTVSAASYEPVSVAPGAIVAAFGAGLATQTVAGGDTDPATPGVQLPTTLGGTTVEVNSRRAALFFVSSGQINYIIPEATESGTASVVVRSGDGTTSSGSVVVSRVSPAIFSANSDGKGAAAAQILRIKANGEQTYESVSEYNQQLGRFTTRPISLGSSTDRVFLILFLSGLSFAVDSNGDNNFNESVRVLIGGNEVTPIFAGRQGQFLGLDQVNLEIPRTLIGRGLVTVTLSATGYASSNLVDIEIAGTTGTAPPAISGFGSAAALAGQEMVINGSGFSTVAADNLVRIAGLDAEVVSATATQLRVMVPYGVQTGSVMVRTTTGEGLSSGNLAVRTSISGVVEDTERQPMSGMTIRLAGSTITALTNTDGAFVLPDVPPGVQSVEIDGGSILASPPYPTIALKVTAQPNRDNQFSRTIAIQQATGSSGTIGGGSGAGIGGLDGGQVYRTASSAVPPVVISTDGYVLQVPGDTLANFPGGATRGTIVLTPLSNARTPVDLPLGFYSAGIVQITPFGVSINPGGKLTFPNPEDLPAGSQVTLFRFDPASGSFASDPARAIVSGDGQTIETVGGAIRVTSIYFVAVQQQTTTITGRVFESDKVTPVRNALARFRGQEGLTDGNGSYVLRYVSVKSGSEAGADISVVRAGGRVDRVSSARVPAVIGGVTRVPDVVMSGRSDNRPPVLLGLSRLDIPEGQTSSTSLLITDPDGSAIADVRVDGASFASVVRGAGANPRSQYQLRLTPGFTDAGSYSLEVSIADDKGAVGKFSIRLTVRDVNRAPAAADGSATGDEDTDITLQLIATDEDPADVLTYQIVTRPTRGVLIGSGPTLTYRPAPNFNGTDQCTWRVSDGRDESRLATMRITVNPVNDAPTATDGSAAGDEDTTIPLVLSATDADGDPLSWTIVSQPANGALTGNGAQRSYRPNANFNGTDRLTFKANDGKVDSNTATVTITVRAVNDAPTASDGSAAGDEDTTIPLVLSATDADGDPLSLTIVSQPANGLLTGTGAQRSYRPNANFNGTDRLTFKANDGKVDSNTATVTITVRAVNDAPTASDSSAAGDEDTTIPLVLSATDADGDPLSWTILSQPANGTLTGTGAQRSYRPNANFNGTDRLTFKANDGKVDSNTATVTITVRAVNDAPTASDGSAAGDQGTDIPVTLSATDVDGDPLTWTIVSPPSGGGLTGTGAQRTYRSGTTFSGTDRFTFRVSDGSLNSNIATVTITVRQVNRPPTASDGSTAGDEDTTISLALSAVDPDGDNLTWTIVTQPKNGTLSGTGAQRSYRPATNFNGTDQFTWKASDGKSDGNTATFFITVRPVNDPPTASDGSTGGDEDTDMPLSLIASDVDGDPLTYTILAPPKYGTLSGSGPQRNYRPGSNYFGPDQFTFRVSDGKLESNTAGVSITVRPVNDPPEVNDSSFTVSEGGTVTVPLVATDPEGDPISFTIVTQPSNGKLSGAGSQWIYSPSANFFGSDKFSWRASDGKSSASAAVYIDVRQGNKAPTLILPNDLSVTFSKELIAQITADDVNKDQQLTITAVSQLPAGASLKQDQARSAIFSWTPTSSQIGTWSISVRVTDNGSPALATTGTFRVTVTK